MDGISFIYIGTEYIFPQALNKHNGQEDLFSFERIQELLNDCSPEHRVMQAFDSEKALPCQAYINTFVPFRGCVSSAGL